MADEKKREEAQAAEADADQLEGKGAATDGAEQRARSAVPSNADDDAFEFELEEPELEEGTDADGGKADDASLATDASNEDEQTDAEAERKRITDLRLLPVIAGVVAEADQPETEQTMALGAAVPAGDGTMVMDAAAVKRALAQAEIDAEFARDADDAGDANGSEATARWRAEGKGRAAVPHAAVSLASVEGSPDADARTAEGKTETPSVADPDVTAYVSVRGMAGSSQSAAFPEAGSTMVMPKTGADNGKESEKESNAAPSKTGKSAGSTNASAQLASTPARDGAESAAAKTALMHDASSQNADSLRSERRRVEARHSGEDIPTSSALFLSAFFDELYRMGMRSVVVSPGSRSTPLAMVAYEMSRRDEYDVRLFVDVDERGAAFFALGLAKATGVPACAICTSGTAGANYYPAVLEAESSRVPLLLLTGDRPPRLQSLGAPQTCNQEKLFGDHVRLFMQMPLPSEDAPSLAFARQAAREAFARTVGAAGPCAGGPVHLNFPFEEPLKPNLDHPDLFVLARSRWCGAPEDAGLSSIGACVRADGRLSDEAAATIEALFAEHTVAIMAGEGSVETDEDAVALLQLAEQRAIPVLADPLSNLRKRSDDLLIDRYDNVLASADCPDFDLLVRFGRYPVSKRATQYVQRRRPVQIVVDQLETRDFNAGTDLFVRMAPRDFVRDLNAAAERAGGQVLKEHDQERFAQAWVRRNAEENARVEKVREVESGFEGAYVRALLDEMPEHSLLFAANSMSIRAVDGFCGKGAQFDILCNRGLNGIDGTLSTALGAAQAYRQTTLLTGDLALLHDLPAFSLNAELMRVHREAGELAPSFIVVLLNNHGGGIFDMLPQKSDDDYFERLFLTPEHADFGQVAAAFDVPYARVMNVADFKTAYASFVGRPGMSVLEVDVPLAGLKERYAPYQ